MKRTIGHKMLLGAAGLIFFASILTVGFVNKVVAAGVIVAGCSNAGCDGYLAENGGVYYGSCEMAPSGACACRVPGMITTGGENVYGNACS